MADDYTTDFETNILVDPDWTVVGNAIWDDTGYVSATHCIQMNTDVLGDTTTIQATALTGLAADDVWYYTSFGLFIPDWAAYWQSGAGFDPYLLSFRSLFNQNFSCYLQPTSDTDGTIQVNFGGGTTYDSPLVPAGEWVAVEVAIRRDSGTLKTQWEIWVNNVSTGPMDSVNGTGAPPDRVKFGDGGDYTGTGAIYYVDNFNYATAVRIGPVDLTGAVAPGGGPSPPVLAPCQSPMWRVVCTDLDTNVTTVLDRIAADRHVEALLDVPNWQSFTVPSDSPLVNIPFPAPGDDPYVAEGDRLVYWFRQESYTPPYFTCRAAGISFQVEDTAQEDDARTKVTSWDPWKLAAYRPAQDADGQLPSQIDPLPTGYWDGKYLTGTSSADIILDQLLNTIVNNGILRIDAGAAHGGTGFYDGTIETLAPLPPDGDGVVFTVQQGMSVADVWTAMVNTFTCDIVLTPIFDPDNRPGYTHQMSIYAQAGSLKDDQIYSWNVPPHSVVNIQRMIDGTQRANKVFFAAGQGGTGGKMAAPATDAASVTKFGEYWAQQYLPGNPILEAVEDLADFQLSIRKVGRTTIQITPAPERSPCPFVEVDLGDRVPVYALADGFRQVLDGLVRIYGMSIDISDDALESYSLILLPQAS